MERRRASLYQRRRDKHHHVLDPVEPTANMWTIIQRKLIKNIFS